MHGRTEETNQIQAYPRGHLHNCKQNNGTKTNVGDGSKGLFDQALQLYHFEESAGRDSGNGFLEGTRFKAQGSSQVTRVKIQAKTQDTKLNIPSQ